MRSKLKILHLAKWYPNPADPQNGIFIQQMIHSQAKFADQAVLYWGPGKAFSTESTVINSVHEYRYFFEDGERLKNANRKWASIRRTLRDKWGKELPDLIHLHVADVDQLLLLEFAWKHKIPVILSEHWSGYLDGRFESKNRIAKSLFKSLLKRVQHCTAVSSFLADGMIKATGRKAIDIIPNAVHVNLLPNTGKKSTHRHFAMLCDLDDRVKNISGVMRAFAKYHEIHPTSQLTIIGGGKDDANLIGLSQKMELTQAIVFAGRLNHSMSLEVLNGADTVIINSFRETFSIVSLEAIALQKRLICTRCGGPEGFLQEELVRWVEVNNDEDLLEAMKETENKPFPTAQQSEGQLEAFTPEVLSKTWETYYRQAVKSGR